MNTKNRPKGAERNDKMSRVREELLEYYFQCRHYCDEYKAYTPESYFAMFNTVSEVFSSVFRVNLETGNVLYREGLTDERCRELLKRLKQVEETMIRIHDPEEDKLYLWMEGQMPWDGYTEKEWMENSHDGPEFRPHMVPFLQEDGARHPAVIITGGHFRQNATEGFPVAEFYQKHGYQAFVLNNRHGMGEKVRKTRNRALDLQLAIRLIRYHAAEWGVREDQIFTNGFSMGNRPTIDLINTLGIQTSPERIDSSYLPDIIDRTDAGIAAFVSVYPAVFPYDDHNRYQDFPPCFFVLGNKDWSLWRMMPFIADLTVNGVKTEVHLLDGADHGFGLGQGKEEPENLKLWTRMLLNWLERQLG